MEMARRERKAKRSEPMDDVMGVLVSGFLDFWIFGYLDIWIFGFARSLLIAQLPVKYLGTYIYKVR